MHVVCSYYQMLTHATSSKSSVTLPITCWSGLVGYAGAPHKLWVLMSSTLQSFDWQSHTQIPGIYVLGEFSPFFIQLHPRRCVIYSFLSLPPTNIEI